jgi:phosphoribosylpyrophosphate synthetase
MSQTPPFKVFSGTNSRYLAEKICNSLGCELGQMNIQHFADGEFAVSFEESIRGCQVYLVQSTFPNSDNLMELLLMIDAAKRASAAKDIVANYDTEEEQVNATRKAVELAEKQGKRTVTNKEINAVQKEAKEAKEIAQALRKVWAYLDGGVMVDVDKLAILLDKTESLSNAMKQYKKLSK